MTELVINHPWEVPPFRSCPSHFLSVAHLAEENLELATPWSRSPSSPRQSGPPSAMRQTFQSSASTSLRSLESDCGYVLGPGGGAFWSANTLKGTKKGCRSLARKTRPLPVLGESSVGFKGKLWIQQNHPGLTNDKTENHKQKPWY